GFGPRLPASLKETAPVLPRLPACREEYSCALAAGHSVSRQPGRAADKPLDAGVEPAPSVQETKLSPTDHVELCAQFGRCGRVPRRAARHISLRGRVRAVYGH